MVSKTPKRTGRRGKTESIDLSRREQDDEEENRKGEGLYRPEAETSKRKNPNGRNRPGTASKPAGQTKTSACIAKRPSHQLYKIII